MSEDGPHILVLGGLGTVGRNIVKYVVDFKLASFVRVVDIKVPAMAALGRFADAFTPTTHFEFLQGDLSNPKAVDAAFAAPAHRPYPFTIVINVAGESGYGFMEMKYERAILGLRKLCAAKAAATGAVDKYIEVSTAQVYECGNERPAREDGAKLKPWTLLGKYHLAAEEAVRATPHLNYIILRLPIVYGPGDVRGLMPRIVCAAVYAHTGDRMEFMWSEDLRIHTVHVQDVAGAVWHLVCAGAVGETYNLVDDNDTSQGKFNAVLESVFRVKTGFHGAMLSTLAKLKLEELVDAANDGHMDPWEEMLAQAGIPLDTPVNPYLEKELLYNNPCAIDGSKLKALGFTCSCPHVTKALVQDAIDFWREQGLFPAAE